MSRAVVLVWLGASSLRTAHEPDLASWADARLVALEDFAPEAHLPTLGHDDATAARVEDLVAEARSLGDPGEAGSALKEAETLLRAHAELPESAWLMAEILRTRAALGVAGSAESALALEQRADALEGRRAEPFDSGFSAGGAKTGGPAADESTTRVVENGAAAVPNRSVRASDEIYVDGHRTETAVFPPGEHHVRIVRGAGLAWAGWTDAAGFAAIRIPGAVPCSEADLDSIESAGTRPKLPHAVACPDWAVARAAGDDRIDVARCRGSDCGTFQPWRRGWGSSFELPVHPPWPEPKSNSWIVWTAASIAAVAVTGVALWQAGVFEGTPERRSVFTIVPPTR